jgi:CheY-like chemotaxis protein
VTIQVRPQTIDANGTLLRFSVHDTGIGIPTDKREYIFQSFTQVDASTTRKYGGTGLGLAICRQLVALLGGEIGVVSEVGKGSEFWFTARFRRQAGEPASEPAPPSVVARQRDYGNARILLVDDSRTNQELIHALLGQWHLGADIAVNGVQAIAALRQHDYDLVLMDVQMPEMDGLEATAKIRDPLTGVRNSKVPIVAMTAHAMAEDRERCLEAGMNDYLSKPFAPVALQRILDGYLAGGKGPPEEPPVMEKTPAETALPVFAQAAFLERVLGDRRGAMRVIRAFLIDIPSRMASIQTALEKGEIAQAADELHTLKGASAFLGGEALRATVLAMEVMAKTGDLASLRSRLPRLQDEVERLRKGLEACVL